MNRLIPAALLSLAALVAAAGAVAAPTRAAAVQHVTLVVKSDTEHAKKGPDGKWHDAYLPGSFRTTAGTKVVVTVRNYDTSAHTFTAPKLHLDVHVEPGSPASPRTTTFTFTAPKAGTYEWYCNDGCDPFAMAHVGYMRGRITVAA